MSAGFSFRGFRGWSDLIILRPHTHTHTHTNTHTHTCTTFTRRWNPDGRSSCPAVCLGPIPPWWPYAPSFPFFATVLENQDNWSQFLISLSLSLRRHVKIVLNVKQNILRDRGKIVRIQNTFGNLYNLLFSFRLFLCKIFACLDSEKSKHSRHVCNIFYFKKTVFSEIWFLK